MAMYSEKPRPRALFIGLDESDLREAKVLDLFPFYKVISDTDELNEVRQLEYDVVIADGIDDLSNIADHLYVITVGGDLLSGAKIKDDNYEFYAKDNSSVAEEMFLFPGTEDQYKYLIEQTQVPLFQNEKIHRTLHARRVVISYGKHYYDANKWYPLLMDGDKQNLCAFAYRSDNKAKTELWYLHPQTSLTDVKKWLELLIEDRWSRKSPDRFPQSNSWKNDPMWQTGEETRINQEIAALTLQFEEATKTYETAVTKLREDLSDATLRANDSSRVLLTSQGNTLKTAVANTLKGFGFAITDMDEEKDDAAGEPKLEDLRAADVAPDETEWVALVEVRGYLKGAKVNDLMRLEGRFTKLYMQETDGRPPSALWFVVNHDLRTSPPSRKLAMKDAPGEAKAFGENDGLIIDTVELFKLVQAVEMRKCNADEARNMLKTAKGIFIYKPLVSPAAESKNAE